MLGGTETVYHYVYRVGMEEEWGEFCVVIWNLMCYVDSIQR